MVLTITLNPAVDKSTATDTLIPDKKLRCDRVITEAGGGGINVSKGLKKLGMTSKALFFSGGNNGLWLENYLQQYGIDILPVRVEGETRESFTVTEKTSNTQYRFVLPGPAISDIYTRDCIRAIKELTPRPEIVVISGSLSPGIPEGFYAELTSVCRSIGARVIMDASGKPLELSLKEGLHLIKPNLNELTGLSGKKSLEIHEVDDVALDIIKKENVDMIVVSLGPAGAIMVAKNAYEHIPAPMVKKNTTVGAGDSMVAGMVYKICQNASPMEIAQFGVACGSAATMGSGTELFRQEDAEKLFKWIREKSHYYKQNPD